MDDACGRSRGSDESAALVVTVPPAGRGLVSLLLTAAACTAAGCGVIPSLGDIVLRPSAEITTTPLTLGFPYTELELSLGAGRRIVAWHVPSDESKALFVLLPGSDRNKSRYAASLPVLVPHGYDVLLIDYEGFGDSPGEPRLDRLLDAANAATDYAMAAHEKVVLFGASLGSPLAVRIAAERDVTALVLEATLLFAEEARLWLQDNDLNVPFFWTVANLYILPQLPDEYDILRYIGQVDEPKLFLHSVEDDVTPFAGGLKIFAAASEPKTFWQMIETHGEMSSVHPELYSGMLISWLDSVVVRDE